jgi:copper chaperone
MYALQVEDMSCAHCVGAVTKAVRALDAGAQVEVDLASKQVRVESGVELARVKAAIIEAGFPVSAAA